MTASIRPGRVPLPQPLTTARVTRSSPESPRGAFTGRDFHSRGNGKGQNGVEGDLGRYLEERAPETRACLSSQRVLIIPSQSPAPVRELTISASSWISRASFPEPARPRKQDTWGRTPLACWRAQVWSERSLRGREGWPPAVLIGRSSGPPPSNWTVSHALLPQMLPVYVIPAPAALDWMVLREVATLLDGTPDTHPRTPKG